MFNAFVNAMNLGPKTTKTQNGADSYTAAGVEDDRVALMFKLVRDLELSTLETFMDRIADIGEERDVQFLADLFVMAFQTRDIRGGKGERDLFYSMFLWLAGRYPVEIIGLLPFVAHYGSYLDLREMWSWITPNSRPPKKTKTGTSSKGKKRTSSSKDTHKTSLADMWRTRATEDENRFMGLREAILDFWAEQLKMDTETPPDRSISLAGKWAPREKSANAIMSHALADRCFPIPEGAGNDEVYTMRKKYRGMCSALNCRLKTIETMMCSGTWKDIDPSAVPARNLKIHRHAFMNKDKQGGQRKSSDDRVQCAKQFEAFLEQCKKDPASAKVHGRNLQPHELVQAYVASAGRVSSRVGDEDGILEAQFRDLCSSIEERGTMSKMCVMLDTSGSMWGGYSGKKGSVPPILPAMGLAAAITRTNHPAFRNFYIRFSADAKMMRYAKPKEEPSLQTIIKFMISDGHIGNTNFEAAMDLILKLCKEHSVPETELPEYLLVLSDMQFDASRGYGNTGFQAHWQKIQSRFKAQGYSRAPKILFWNLQANSVDFPAPRDAEGVEMISGFSTTLLKYFLEGDLSKANPTPFETMRRQLDDVRYDPLRLHFSEYKEGPFAEYQWVPEN